MEHDELELEAITGQMLFRADLSGPKEEPAAAKGSHPGTEKADFENTEGRRIASSSSAHR